VLVDALTRVGNRQGDMLMIRYGMIALATCVGANLAAAQTPPTVPGQPSDTIMHTQPPLGASTALELTPAQRTTILNAIRQDTRRSSPINFVVSVGAPVPPSIELYMLPDKALSDVPQAKIVKYTVVQDQIVLVDPTTMRVVDVLR
jgi:hypothetical protein